MVALSTDLSELKKVEEYAKELQDALKKFSLNICIKDDSVIIDHWIQITKDMIEVRTLAGKKERPGYIVTGYVPRPSCRWDEPDDVDEVSIYEGFSMQAAVQASIAAIIKHKLDQYSEDIQNRLEYELEKAEGI